jgi:hypothetical protein
MSVVFSIVTGILAVIYVVRVRLDIEQLQKRVERLEKDR